MKVSKVFAIVFNYILFCYLYIFPCKRKVYKWSYIFYDEVRFSFIQVHYQQIEWNFSCKFHNSVFFKFFWFIEYQEIKYFRKYVFFKWFLRFKAIIFSFNASDAGTPFELAVLDEGDAFDLESGVFSASAVSKIYHFQVSAVKYGPWTFFVDNSSEERR